MTPLLKAAINEGALFLMPQCQTVKTMARTLLRPQARQAQRAQNMMDQGPIGQPIPRFKFALL